MTAPDPSQGPPVVKVPMMFMPTPSHMQVDSERSADGQLIVTLTVMQPMATMMLVMAAEQARALADKITTAATGIEVAKGPLFVDDILKGRPT